MNLSRLCTRPPATCDPSGLPSSRRSPSKPARKRDRQAGDQIREVLCDDVVLQAVAGPGVPTASRRQGNDQVLLPRLDPHVIRHTAEGYLTTLAVSQDHGCVTHENDRI